jgi:hypothetical protein
LYQISHVYERIHSNEINGIKKSNVWQGNNFIFILKYRSSGM